MKEKTKHLINYRQRFYKGILDYVEYISIDGQLVKNPQVIEDELQKLIIKNFKNYKVLPFGSVPQDISTMYSDLDLEIIT